MRQKKVVIIGGGFAGIAAVAYLKKKRVDIRITLIDKKRDHEFLPLLPDIVGRRITPIPVQMSLQRRCDSSSCEFIQEEVIGIDESKQEIRTQNMLLPYDFCIVACGSESNFYGNRSFKHYALTLDSVADAVALRNKIIALSSYDRVIIVGGGYAGIEIATHIRNVIGFSKKISLVDAQAVLFPALSPTIRTFIYRHLKTISVDLFLNTSIKSIDHTSVVLSNNKHYTNSLLIWSAGVKTPDFLQTLACKKNRQGRLEVNEFLQISQTCFAAGDVVLIMKKRKEVRMGVQFALSQGKLAAQNIMRLINKKRLLSYKQKDLGFVIPIAQNKSCGVIFGRYIHGYLPTLLHYFMCLYRVSGFLPKCFLLRELLSDVKKLKRD
ncbi:NAD(P)/FAD-dependent oxidoreductase [Chlamydiota bacterium]